MVVKEVKDPKTVVLLRGIYTSMLLIGEPASGMAVIACNRYLEKPSNLPRPASVTASSQREISCPRGEASRSTLRSSRAHET